jgi:phosphatidylglycerophosphate synthase
MLDGMVAIESGRTSPVGELFNEVPDRVSDAAILVGLGYSAGGSPALGWALALAAVFTAYVRAEGRVAGAAQDYGGPLAKPQRMFGVTVIALWCGLAPGAWVSGVPAWGALVLLAGTVATAVRRLHRIGRALRR